MSQENVEIVRRGFEAWEQGDLQAHLRLFHEDVVCSRVAPLINPKAYHGVEGYLEFAGEWMAPYDELRFLPNEYMDAGNRVLVEVPQEGRLAGSNQVVRGTFWFLMTLHGGKVIRLEIYGDQDQALEAAGLRE
jgi:ketosteroid isomerase-like protein